MDTHSGKSEFIKSWPNFYPAVLHTIQGIFRWLGGFFTFTEEDRQASGIDVNNEGRE